MISVMIAPMTTATALAVNSCVVTNCDAYVMAAPAGATELFSQTALFRQILIYSISRDKIRIDFARRLCPILIDRILPRLHIITCPSLQDIGHFLSHSLLKKL